MFVGFIAIIVVLLIIVAAMSTGSTSGSGGVDQTQATKVLSEYSGLAQSFDFFKTTTQYSDYEGITVQKLVDNGIVNAADTDDATGAACTKVNSKALAGVSYTVATGASNSEMKVTLTIDTTVVSASAEKAVNTTFTSKLGSAAVVNAAAHTIAVTVK